MESETEPVSVYIDLFLQQYYQQLWYRKHHLQDLPLLTCILSGWYNLHQFLALDFINDVHVQMHTVGM